MNLDSSLLVFIISAFALGVVLILTKDNIPQKLRRGSAIAAIIMISAAFIFMVYGLFTLGQ